MSEIKDSGTRREFETGAVRDMGEGKGRCDLLPLDIISDRLDDEVYTLINDYIRRGSVMSLWFALNTWIGLDETLWYTALLDLSKHYEAGCAKYGDRNWEKGIPLHCYIDSAVRHYLKHRRGDTDEPHDKAFIWNLMCAIWTHKNKPEMIDLPFAAQAKQTEQDDYSTDFRED